MHPVSLGEIKCHNLYTCLYLVLNDDLCVLQAFEAEQE